MGGVKIGSNITEFLSTLSLRRATWKWLQPCSKKRFLSTLSLRRATHWLMALVTLRIFLSTLSLRRATHRPDRDRRRRGISIHALLAESDVFILVEGVSLNVISIHALLAESDQTSPLYKHLPILFLSTLSLRRATSPCCGWFEVIHHFYPRSPCGERLWPGLLARPFFLISIHALLAESDYLDRVSALAPKQFLSTLSLRRAT